MGVVWAGAVVMLETRDADELYDLPADRRFDGKAETRPRWCVQVATSAAGVWSGAVSAGAGLMSASFI